MKKYIIVGLIAIFAIALVVNAQTNVFFRLAGTDTVYRAYQTAAEFFSDGGAQDFSNVRVIPNDTAPVLGSVTVGNEYRGITTAATTTGAYLFKKGPGAFGSVIINVLGTGNVVFYDASTTIPANRTVQATSSLPVVGYIAASQAAGTYTYDVYFGQGLIGVFSGTQGTSTITWR